MVFGGGDHIAILSLLASVVAIVLVIFPLIAKLLLYYFYSPLFVIYHKDSSRHQHPDLFPDDIEENWDVFHVSLEKTGRITPFVERIEFYSSIPLEGNSTNVQRMNPSSKDLPFHYQWNLRIESAGRVYGKKIETKQNMHLPFERPADDFRLRIVVIYKIPLRKLGLLWASGFLYLKPIELEHDVDVPDVDG